MAWRILKGRIETRQVSNRSADLLFCLVSDESNCQIGLFSLYQLCLLALAYYVISWKELTNLSWQVKSYLGGEDENARSSGEILVQSTMMKIAVRGSQKTKAHMM